MGKALTFVKKHFLELVVFGLILVVYTSNLSGQGFSLDEPETILVAKNILTKGFPSPWDGKIFVTVINGLDSTKIGENYVWSLHPWLQYYLVAGSFMAFGESVFSARFPFVFFGFLTTLLVYLISRSFFGKKKISLLVPIILSFSLPFFLYSRQARHYSIESFFGLLSFCLILGNPKRIFNFLLAFSLIFLFLSNYFSWITIVLAGGIYLWIKGGKRILFSFLPSILLAGFWIMILKPAGGNPFIHFKSIGQILINFFSYISYINSYLFSLILLIPLYFALRKTKSEKWKNFLFLFGLLFGLKMFLYSIFINPHGRYLYELIPYFSIITLFVLESFIKSKYIFLIILFILIFTNVFNIFPKVFFKKVKLNFYPIDFYYELTKKYKQYLPWLGNLLKKDANDGDIYWASRLPLTIYYYSKISQLSFVCDKNKDKKNLLGPAETDKTKVKYYIFHHSDSQKLSDYRCFDQKDEANLALNYDKLKTKFPNDLYAENDPDIVNRLFPPRKIYPDEVTIYKRK